MGVVWTLRYGLGVVWAIPVEVLSILDVAYTSRSP